MGDDVHGGVNSSLVVSRDRASKVGPIVLRNCQAQILDVPPRSAYVEVMSARPCCVFVDDDENFLSLARRHFSQICPDFDVIAFSSSLEALDFLVRSRVALVITDFNMPFVDGLQLTRLIRSTDANVPVFVMSYDEVGSEALAHGANAFLPKRAISSELGAALERVGIQIRAANNRSPQPEWLTRTGR